MSLLFMLFFFNECMLDQQVVWGLLLTVPRMHEQQWASGGRQQLLGPAVAG
jgi:hypothetical protein